MSQGNAGLNTVALTEAQELDLRTEAAGFYLQTGRFYTGGTKRTVTNNQAVLQLRNPTGSGRIILLQQFSLAADASVDVQFIRNATVNAPTAHATTNMNFSSADASVGIVESGVTGTTNGTALQPITRLSGNITIQFALPVLLPPGTSIAASFQAGVITQLGCYATAAWAEVNL